MLDFNAGEILLLVVLAVIIFGPEKLPDLARKAARVVNYLRQVANDARGQLREHVPELADLDLTDLNPRRLGTKLLGAATVDELAETGRSAARDLREGTGRATGSARQHPAAEEALVVESGDSVGAAVPAVPEGSVARVVPNAPRVVAFDPEAT